MSTQFDVYHQYMRSAQIYAGEVLSGYEPARVDTDLEWSDFLSNPLLGTVLAEDEAEAVKIVAEKRGVHMGSLFALPHVVQVSTITQVEEKEYPLMFRACSFDEIDKTGINVTLPDSRDVFVFFDKIHKRLKLVITDSESANSSCEIFEI